MKLTRLDILYNDLAIWMSSSVVREISNHINEHVNNDVIDKIYLSLTRNEPIIDNEARIYQSILNRKLPHV